MFNFAVSRESLLSGFQWFFFIFCNTVVVPPTLLSAFQLPQSSLLTLTQYAFLATALACFAQAFCGHRRAIMEGPGGLWWGTILTITLGEASRGTPINDIATSLAVGIALSGVLTMLIGFSGLGHRLARLFTPSVMVLFMLMLGAQLTTIFFKGMLGLPFGIACGVVINSGLSPSSQYKPVGLDWCGMWEISPILDRFEENAQKCFFLRFFLGEFAQIMQQT